jgi:hypothetical protein
LVTWLALVRDAASRCRASSCMEGAGGARTRCDQRPRSAALLLRRSARPIKIMSLICQSGRRGIACHGATQEGTKANEYRDVVTSGGTSQHQIWLITRAGSVGVRGSSPLSSTSEPCVYGGFRVPRVGFCSACHSFVIPNRRARVAPRVEVVLAGTVRHDVAPPTETLWCDRFNRRVQDRSRAGAGPRVPDGVLPTA